MKSAVEYPILSVKRSPAGDCLAIRNAIRDGDKRTWMLFSEEGECTDSVLLNNNHRSFFAKLLMRREADLNGLFELRPSMADQWIDEYLAEAKALVAQWRTTALAACPHVEGGSDA